jgi:hypothetical protein
MRYQRPYYQQPIAYRLQKPALQAAFATDIGALVALPLVLLCAIAIPSIQSSLAIVALGCVGIAVASSSFVAFHLYRSIVERFFN